MEYKEKGGVNWCLCEIIAERGGKVWIHNLDTGTMPLKCKNSVEFRNNKP